MIFLYALLVCISAMITSCKSTPKPPDPPQPILRTLLWTPGNCRDNFIVYKDVDGLWTYVGETTHTQYPLTLAPKEVKVVSVAGVCMTGENKGEWMSMEEVTIRGN